MSGWPEIDYDPAVWIELPMVWDEQTWPDHRAWARDLAEASWGDSGLVPAEYQVDNLALTLALFAEKLQSGGPLPAQHFFLHLPDPRMMPLQVCLGVWDAAGERDAALRELTGADDPEAVEPPLVEVFPTEHLGDGLRTLRYCPFDPGPGHPPDPAAIYATLNYAWRVDGHGTDVRLFSSCPDLARLIPIIDDIDALARGIRIVALTEDPVR
ncbi:MAG: hypothetical protein ACRDSR_23180 [Pseudonocardiaceae bacterium]